MDSLLIADLVFDCRTLIHLKMICVQQPPTTRNRKETLIPKETDEMIEVLSVVGDITNVMTIDSEHFVEVMTSSSSSCSETPDAAGVRPRKRAKLDHLSADEKAQHRKMMNRISAQSARDRQKQQMVVQEVQIKELMNTVSQIREDWERCHIKHGLMRCFF